MTQEQIFQAVASGGGWYTRKDIADMFGRLKSTCVITMVERLVKKGKLEKSYGYYNSVAQAAWYYKAVKNG